MPGMDHTKVWEPFLSPRVSIPVKKVVTAACHWQVSIVSDSSNSPSSYPRVCGELDASLGTPVPRENGW